MNIKHFCLISSLFFITIIGLTYTSDFDQAMSNIKTPFLIFPLIVLSVSPLTYNDKKKLLDLFSIAVILAAILGIAKACWLYYAGLGNYFYYLDFAKVLNKHTTYFSLFVCISLINIVYHLSFKRNFMNICKLLASIFLIIVLYLLSTKISFISLTITVALSLILSLFRKNHKRDNMKIARIVVLIILPLMFITPNLKKRILKDKASNLAERIILWNAALDSYLENDLIFGAGTGDGHEGLIDSYKEINYEIAIKENYNAHSQYLEQLLFFGVIGLILLVLLLFYTLNFLLSQNQTLFFLIYFTFVIYMFSESILERHSGLVLFSFLTSIFLSNSKRKRVYANSQYS